jgi:hypothetical protein
MGRGARVVVLSKSGQDACGMNKEKYKPGGRNIPTI